ncbi:MAG: thioredoxin family protein [Rubripirellula sp.]
MIRLSYVLWFPLLLWMAAPVQAGKYNPKLDVGDAAPSWESLPGVDGKSHSLVDLRDAKAVVVVFTCNSCPYALDVEDRVIALHKKYQSKGVALVAINVNKVEEDRLPAMKDKAKEKAFLFPYLFDESQQIARDFGATRTPEFFVLDGDRNVVYMGAMDDSPEGREVKKHFVEAALDATLSGAKVEVGETIPIGCSVRFERARRTRRVKRD